MSDDTVVLWVESCPIAECCLLGQAASKCIPALCFRIPGVIVSSVGYHPAACYNRMWHVLEGFAT